MARPKLYDESLRRALQTAAAQVIAVGGVGALSLRDLAASVGTSTNAIYALFGGKDALVSAVVAEADRSMSAHLGDAVGAADNLFDLLAVGVAYRSWALANRELYDVMYVRRPPELRIYDPSTDGPGDVPAAMVPLLKVTTRLVETGVFRPAEPLDVARSQWAWVHGHLALEVALWPDTGLWGWRDYFRHNLLLVRGLLSDPDTLDHIVTPEMIEVMLASLDAEGSVGADSEVGQEPMSPATSTTEARPSERS